MSVYASVPAYADRRRHPRALFLIVAGHAALLAAVMTAKMDLPAAFQPTITKIDLIDAAKPPPENSPPPTPERKPKSVLDQPLALVPLPRQTTPSIDSTPLPLPIPDLTLPITPTPETRVAPPQPVRTGPRFVTPRSQIEPPYPQSKLAIGEEAALRLRLSIDERGRVTSVQAIGPADPVFLAAARKHLIAHWSYQPAKEDGRAVASSTVITLRFELER
ncbi:MAG TPA: energy transducer TonB [Sphingomicrobium sp.]|nr:energy transducer TonB [Sphingomicrobium sp.]